MAETVLAEHPERGRPGDEGPDDDRDADRHDEDSLDGVPVLQPGELVAAGYRVVEHLSRGDALDVYEVFSSERLCSCVAKVVRPDRVGTERVRARLWQEGHLLQTLSHPHLLRGLELIAHPDLVVVTETVPGLSLEELIWSRSRRLPVEDLCHLAMQLAAATAYLHGAGYLHLDLTPANVIASGGSAKVIDLSLSRPPGAVPRGLGTREYLSPEQARGEVVSAAADVWGLGTVLYEATTGVSPFGPLDPDEEAVLARRGYLQLERPAPPLSRWRRRLPARLRETVEACLEPVAAARPSVRQVWDAFDGLLDELDPDR